MIRFSLVVLERDARAVLRDLGASGAVQLVRTPAGPDTAPLAPLDCSAELARCTSLRMRVEELQRALDTLLPRVGPVRPADLTLTQADQALGEMEAQASQLRQRQQDLGGSWRKLTDRCSGLASYRRLELPLLQDEPDSFLHFVTGTLPPENFRRLQSDVAGPVAWLPLETRGDRQVLLAMTTRAGRTALDAALARADFVPTVRPGGEKGTIDSWLAAAEAERAQLQAALKRVTEELHARAVQYAQPLAEIAALTEMERGLFEAQQHFPRTEASVLIRGWVPAADAPAVATRVRRTTENRCALELEAPAPGGVDQTPVLLRHSRWLRPFTVLVTAYGLPQYHELEPTLFVAISYVLMFGMMFGDAGHGAILAAGGLFLLRSSRREPRRDLGLLLLFSGLSSLAFGLVYGSCFGLAACKSFALWHDPLEGDPMALLSVAVGIGIVLISLGLILNIINRFQRGDVLGGFLDKFGVVGVIFYWGALLLIAKAAALQSRGLFRLAAVVFLGLPLLGWACKAPLEYWRRRRRGPAEAPGAGWFDAVTESLVGAFEAVLSYLANTISFVRLAAYAMSHAALLMAAFTLADQMKHLSGGVLSVVVIVLGNLVALVLEGLIAAVQALRLEYYEFFGKFFSGSGQAFKPFRLAAPEPASG